MSEITPEMEELLSELEKYKEDGFFKRIGKMIKGLSKPHDSREYKIARIELQRLSAPLTAILLPSVGVAVIFVLLANSGTERPTVKIDITQQSNEEETLEDIEEPVETPPDEPQEDTMEMPSDVPSMDSPVQADNSTPVDGPVSPRPAEMDAMTAINSPVVMKSVMGSSRSSGIRGKYTNGGKGYGDARTEAAVMKALRWLKKNQRSDGSWGYPASATTGFAVLTFLAHGETPSSKEFGDTVQLAIQFLINDVKNLETSPRFGHSDGHEYTFGIGTYALCEAYGMTKNPDIGEVALKCLQRLIDNQSSTGWWDYKIDKTSRRDDVSIGGWCIQAIKAGKMAGLHPDGIEDCIKKAIRCLQTRLCDDRLGFVYCATARTGSQGLAGVGCLAMQLLGYGKEPQVRNALSVMSEWLPSFEGSKLPQLPKSCMQYYCYYAAQCKYQAGMSETAIAKDKDLWIKWNTEMKALYPDSITTIEGEYEFDGKQYPIGFWENQDVHKAGKDHVMDTCLCALQLMVYYRYLPTTSLKATEVETDIDEAAKGKDEVGVTIDL